MVPEEFLGTIHGGKGGMEMVDAAWHEEVISRLPSPPSLIPGGSSGNTIFALARLGIPTAMLGKLGTDANGRYYAKRLCELGGEDSAFIWSETEPTGRCMSLVTPDSERTMRTHLGASVTLTPEEAASADFSRFALVHIEGYMLFNLPAVREVVKLAKAAGCEVSLDLASYEVVNIFRSDLQELLRDYIDIVFANEDEGRAFAGSECSTDEMLERLHELCAIAVLKLGREGARIMDREGRITRVGARVVTALDTTGAGDLWQAGFLFGYLNNHDWESCGRYGALLGAEVVQILGAQIPDERWDRIKQEISNGCVPAGATPGKK